MNPPSALSDPNWPRLWTAVESQFRGDLNGIHGRSHWLSVMRNAIMLAEREKFEPAALVTVRLFAAFHDSQRVCDDWDKGHGQRAADFARQQRGILFDLPDLLFNKLADACAGHELGQTTLDPIIGVCWDADRLDLIRVGAAPREAFMNTPEGKRLARVGWTGKPL